MNVWKNNNTNTLSVDLSCVGCVSKCRAAYLDIFVDIIGSFRGCQWLNVQACKAHTI